MAESTSLQLITTTEQRKTAERLWQLYSHDLSEFRGYMPDSSGRYENARLLSFFGNPDRCGYLTYSDGALVGFALIRGLAGEIRVIGDFFVIRAARRQRVGHDAAVKLMSIHPGRWAIPFQEETGALPASGGSSAQNWPSPTVRKSDGPSRGNQRNHLTYGCFSAPRADSACPCNRRRPR